MLLFSVLWMLIIYIVGQLTIEKTGYDDGEGYDVVDVVVVGVLVLF